MGYWGLVFTHGLPWALIRAAVGLLMGSAPLADFYLVTYLIFRAGLPWLTGGQGMGDRQLVKSCGSLRSGTRLVSSFV